MQEQITLYGASNGKLINAFGLGQRVEAKIEGLRIRVDWDEYSSDFEHWPMYILYDF